MRHPIAFEDLHALILESLRADFEITKGRTISFEDFARDILAPICGNDDPAVEDAYEIILQFVSEDDRKKGKEHVSRTKSAAIIVAAAYLNRSRLAHIDGNLDLAWSYIADARYWNGVASASRGIDSAFRQTVSETKRGVATKGAQARAQSYDVLAQFAQHQARTRAPENGGWQSRNQAVQSVKGIVLARAKEVNVRLSENQADKTIDKWLARMPDSERFFSKKTKKK